MFKTILVPLDGSELAEKALPYAKLLAQKSSGRIELVRAVEVHAAMPHDGIEKTLEARQLAATELAAIAAELRRDGPETAEHVYDGEPVKAIELAAEASGADCIVMATHGRSGLARWAFGSVAERVLRLGGLPVLMIPAHPEGILQGDGSGTVMVPLDGSPLAEEALEAAKDLAHLVGASLTLIQVIEPPNMAYAAESMGYYPIIDLDACVADAKPYLVGVAARLAPEALEVNIEAVVGYAAATIVKLAAAKQATFIVMASHGRTGLARAILGSVAMGVVQRSAIPTLIVRPAALAAEPESQPERELRGAPPDLEARGLPRGKP